VVKQGGFLRSVLVLVGGTAFAHAITALALPILTRLYTPADFSVLAVFSSLLSIVSVAACLRFDIAIPLPESDGEAFTLLMLALLCLLGFSGICSLIVLAAPSQIADVLGRSDILPYLCLLPIGVFLVGAYSTLQNWFVRKKQFALVARSRVAQSAASAGTQVGMAMGSYGGMGLVVGYLLNSGAACLALGYRLFREERVAQNRLDLSWRGLKQSFIAYSRFPKYSTWESLCNSAAIQLPVIMIAALATGPEVGYLLLAMSVIQAPMALFGAAIGQVYLSRAPQEHRNGRLGEFTAEILGGLIRAGVGPLLVLGVVSPAAFGIVFGPSWERAGWLVAWMTPWFIMQFLASPLSMALHVTGHQKAALLLQLLGLFIRVLTVLVTATISQNYVTESYAISGFIMYSLYLGLVAYCVDLRAKNLTKALLSTHTLAGWIAVSLICLITLSMLL
jgi:O-antigen/teichoic acid export membrane protein